MLVSVVIPTRHRNDLLARCLERLAPGRQTLPRDAYEVVVTDDGTATTAEALVRGQFPWARWTQGPRRGPAANRNHGAALAGGAWLAFTDDDCLPTPGWLKTLMAATGGGVDVVEGRTTCAAGLRTAMQEAPINLTGGCLWSCNMLVRRGAFDTLGGFDAAFPDPYCEDVDFNVRVTQAGLGRHFAPDAVVDHPPRRRPGGLAEGRRWESRALLWFKHGHRAPLWRWMPVHVAKVRVRHLFQFPFGRDTLAAAGSFAVEWAYVVAHLRAWERRHRAVATRAGPR